MYVILKGKIAVKVQMNGKEDIQVLIAMPVDGECFGELSLYDFNKIKVQTAIKVAEKNSSIEEQSDQRFLVANNMVEVAPDVKRRGGTCVAVEETLCLRIDHHQARSILQPDCS
jgi:hypothetical protein